MTFWRLLHRNFLAVTVPLFVLLAIPSVRASNLATIRGTVTADKGQVIGFMVKARDPKAKMTYDVFTRKGRYRVPNLPPASYEVWVHQRAYDSPVKKVELKPGENAQLDFKVTLKDGYDLANEFRPRDPHTSSIDYNLKLVSFDKLYPPGPGRDVLEKHCFACHGTWFHHLRNSRAGWEFLVKNMTDRRDIPNYPKRNIIYTKENFPTKDRQLIIDYLASNFGPGAPMRDLKLDELRPDEDVISKSMYIEYDVPPGPGEGPRSYHDPHIAPDGGVWFDDRANHSLLRINPDALDAADRVAEEYQTPWPSTRMHGLTIDRLGHVYYADIQGGYLGQLDLRTGKYRRFVTSGLPDESMVQIVVDSKNNIWGGLISGNYLFKFDPRTEKVKLWHWPTPDTNPYGMIVSHDDKIWTAGISVGKVIKFDPDTEKFTEYVSPPVPSAPRRLGEDLDHNIWWAEYQGGHVGELNPKTGKIRVYPFPLKFSRGYDCWPVGRYVWVTEATYQSLVRIDRKTKKFVYYPLPLIEPSGNPGVPKLEVGHDGTIWFAYRGVHGQPNPVVAFKPLGNANLH